MYKESMQAYAVMVTVVHFVLVIAAAAMLGIFAGVLKSNININICISATAGAIARLTA